MQQRPQVAVAFEDDMCAAAAIPTVRPAHGSELVAQEVLISCAAMATTAKNTNLVYKIAFLHVAVISVNRKYIPSARDCPYLWGISSVVCDLPL